MGGLTTLMAASTITTSKNNASSGTYGVAHSIVRLAVPGFTFCFVIEAS